ncbi:Uncharacterised protein [Vibrio cholerae]|nr:Uncharacterised protein [Vibrio cholerae]CSI36946.1 Uncharacterised protein [Vibrio cholerae]
MVGRLYVMSSEFLIHHSMNYKYSDTFSSNYLPFQLLVSQCYAQILIKMNKKSTLGLTHCVEYGTNLLT